MLTKFQKLMAITGAVSSASMFVVFLCLGLPGVGGWIAAASGWALALTLAFDKRE